MLRPMRLFLHITALVLLCCWSAPIPASDQPIDGAAAWRAAGVLHWPQGKRVQAVPAAARLLDVAVAGPFVRAELTQRYAGLPIAQPLVFRFRLPAGAGLDAVAVRRGAGSWRELPLDAAARTRRTVALGQAGATALAVRVSYSLRARRDAAGYHLTLPARGLPSAAGEAPAGLSFAVRVAAAEELVQLHSESHPAQVRHVPGMPVLLVSNPERPPGQ